MITVYGNTIKHHPEVNDETVIENISDLFYEYLTPEHNKLMNEYKDFIGQCIPDHRDPNHPWEHAHISETMVMNIYECQ